MQKNFSYPLIVEDIAAAEKKYRLTADAADLKELAEILQIPSVKSFSAEIYTKMNNCIPINEICKVFAELNIL